MSQYLRKLGGTLLVGLVAIWLQGGFLKGVTPGSMIAPNLIIGLVVVAAFREVSSLGVLLAFLLGLELDLFSGGRLGPWAGASVLVFTLIAFLAQRLFSESGVAIIVASFCGAVVSSLSVLLLSAGSSFSEGFFLRALIEAGLTGVATPILVWFVGNLLFPPERTVGRTV